MRDPARAPIVQPGARCPVLSVPDWFWSLLDLGAMIERGVVDIAAVDCYTWELAVSVRAIHADAQRAVAETERRESEARKLLLQAVRS